MKIIISLLIISTLQEFINCKEIQPSVTTQEGELIGKTLTSRNGRPYSAFLGIPYAQQPKRFEDPEPPLKWSGVRNATEFGSICVQDTWLFDYEETIEGSEDCLFLNVYSPSAHNSDKKMAVMVFIHGGGFMFGAGHIYGANYLMDHDVVYVSLNYRLGALGFLNTGDGVVSGNFGMKDQVMALKWVQRNIGAFGGDNNKITIFGESAGSASVTFHMLSKMSKGLFHRVIAQSGTPLCGWALIPKPKYFADRLGAKLNCPTDSTTELVECLKRKEAHEIARPHFRRWHLDTSVPFGPTSEIAGANKEVFFSGDPLDLLQKGEFNKVPILMGVMEAEGLLLHAASVLLSEKLTKELDKDWNEVAPITFLFDKHEQRFSAAEEQKMSKEIRKFYFKDESITTNGGRNLVELYSDRWFVHGVRSAGLFMAKHSDKNSPVFNYIFNYRGENPAVELLGVTDKTGVYAAATHVDEMKYLFNTDYFPRPLEKRSEEFSNKFVKIWVDFADSGVLTIDGKKLKPESSDKEPTWYEINEHPVKEFTSPFTPRMELWDRLLGYKMDFTSKNKIEL